MEMTAHKHAEIIKAKADDMDLVVLGRYKSKETEWEEVSYQHLIGHENYQHFLCLPQHKEAVLCGLNGGDFQVKCLGEFSSNWYLDCNDWRKKRYLVYG